MQERNSGNTIRLLVAERPILPSATALNGTRVTHTSGSYHIAAIDYFNCAQVKIYLNGHLILQSNG